MAKGLLEKLKIHYYLPFVTQNPSSLMKVCALTTPKSIVLVLFFGLIISSAAVSQDIRNNNWGDSMAKVKAAEGQKDWKAGTSDDGNKYIYTISKIGGLETMLAWYFVDDKLFTLRYIFLEEHQNKNLFISDFERIKEILDAKYGDVRTEKIWSNSLYKDDPDDYGFAVSLGHYSLWTERENDKTKISHLLTGDNYEIKHEIMYRSKELDETVKEKSKSKELSEF